MENTANANVCRWGDTCRTKGCRFNHPSRTPCRNDLTCTRNDCFDNHTVIMCQFGAGCTKRATGACNYRHAGAHDQGSELRLSSKPKLTDNGPGPHFSQHFPPQRSSNIPAAGAEKLRQGAASSMIKEPSPTICRNGDGCHTKGCRFNHPGRALCPDDQTCPRIDCRFSHSILLCQFDQRCTKKKNGTCQYRHSGNGTSVKPLPQAQRQDFRPKIELSDNGMGVQKVQGSIPKQPVRLENPSAVRPETETGVLKHEAAVIGQHHLKIRAEKQKLTSFVVSPDFNASNPTSTKTISAYQSRIRELETHLNVFQAFKQRALRHFANSPLDLKYQLLREIYRLKSGLPALAKRAEIEACIENGSSRFLIVQGETGSGKSTQVVQYLADHPRFSGKRIVCTQPRKIAAVSLANRVTFEYAGGNELAKVGFQVGFHVGGQKRCFNRKQSRIEFATEGIMLERIIAGASEPFEDVGCIVIDEAHERSITCDLLLGCLRLDDTRWNNIMVVVTSATIDLAAFSSYFGNAPTVEIAGRTFPVDTHYCPIAENSDIQACVVSCALNIHKGIGQNPGDILCFLPGQDDVLNAKAAFDAQAGRLDSSGLLKPVTLTLYGKQDPEEQRQAFAKLPNTERKIIFSTDIAETSVTIDGVVYVVDSGVRKEMTFDPKRNISSLSVNQISRGSAIQRAGRAGRTQPGHCYRLYSAQDYDQMEASATPEIFRRPLSLAILSLREMKINTSRFQWISPPEPDTVVAAEQELMYLGAITGDGQVTDLGRLVIQSQQEPKLVRMIYRGCEQGMGMAALTIAGALSVGSLFFWPGNTPESKTDAKKCRQELCDPDGDLVTLYKLYKIWATISEGGEEYTFEQEDEQLEFLAQLPRREETETLGSQFVMPLGSVPSARQTWLSEEETQDPDELEMGYATETQSDEQLENDQFDQFDTASIAPSQTSNTSDLSSLQESIDEVDMEVKRLNRKRGKRLASAWCRKNFINGKAVGIMNSTIRDLQNIFRRTNVWTAVQSQTNEPTNEELNRLICSGFYLNCARLIQSKIRASQYYSVFSETLGNLDFKSALLQGQANGPINADIKQQRYNWIIYDKIMQISLVLFPMASPIREEWIQEEVQQVYPQLMNIFKARCAALPTEKVVIYASATCLRHICGKYFCNLPALEEELASSLEVGLKEGRIQVFCTAGKRLAIEQTIQKKLAAVVQELEQDTMESVVEEGAATRALLGSGYEVKEIVFPGEFATLHIRKLPQACTKDEIEHFLANCGYSGLVSVNLFQYRAGSGATLKFQGKQHAKAALEVLKGELFHGRTIEIAAPELATANATYRNIRQSQSCRLTVSWATNPSAGRALITFRTPADANHVIQSVGVLFGGARVTRVHGELHPTGTTDQAKTPHLDLVSLRPKIMLFKLHQPWAQDESGPLFVITIVDLRKDIDELAIRKTLAQIPINPTRITVARENNEKNARAQQATENTIVQRDAFLAPLRPVITRNTITTDFFSKSRGGVHVVLEDPQYAPTAYEQALQEYEIMECFNGQPIRLELEYTQWTSIHVDLYKFFQAEIETVNVYARSRGLTTSNPNRPNAKNEASKFVSLSYRGLDRNTLHAIQTRLQQAITYRAFNHRDRDLLFTWTGRNIMEQLSLGDRAFIHWDTKTHAILIYGQEQVQDFVQEQLVAVIEQIKQFEEVDKLFLLSTNKENDLSKVTNRAAKICSNQGAFYCHVVKNRLYVTGSQDTCTQIEAELLREQLLRPTGQKLDLSRGECGLCFCDLDRNFLTTSVCGHHFCTECLQPMFETVPPPQPPIKCPQDGCGRSLPVQDVIKFATADATRTMLEYAIGAYRAAHPELVTICPKPGCNQLLPSSSRNLAADPHCFVCQVTYCLRCTEQIGKATGVHPGESCAQSQRGLSQATLVHLKHIRENILNYRCPRCRLVIWEFDGCCAVTCKCGGAFCGICFQACPSSNEAHSHVTRCPRSPNPGNLFLSREELNRAHNAGRVGALRLYIQAILDREVLSDVRKYLPKDLTDLGINPTQVFGA